MMFADQSRISFVRRSPDLRAQAHYWSVQSMHLCAVLTFHTLDPRNQQYLQGRVATRWSNSKVECRSVATKHGGICVFFLFYWNLMAIHLLYSGWLSSGWWTNSLLIGNELDFTISIHPSEKLVSFRVLGGNPFISGPKSSQPFAQMKTKVMNHLPVSLSSGC